jgi:ABC-type amino acid transport substrate-binding protein
MIRFLILLGALLGASLGYAAPTIDTLAEIKSSGVIRLGYLDSAPPFSFQDTGNGPAGYSVDICRYVAEGIREQLGLKELKVEWVPLTLQTRLPAVRDRKVHVECGTTTWTLSRQEMVDFSLMTFVDGGTVLVRADTELLRLADLNGKRIAVVPGTTTESSLKQALMERKLNAQVVEVKSPDAGIAMLRSGQVDGYASDRLVLLGLGLQAQGAHAMRLLDEDFSVEPYALALPRGDYGLRLAVNRQLASLFRTGRIEGIYQKWLGPLGRPSMLLSALYFLQAIPE